MVYYESGLFHLIDKTIFTLFCGGGGEGGGAVEGSANLILPMYALLSVALSGDGSVNTLSVVLSFPLPKNLRERDSI